MRLTLLHMNGRGYIIRPEREATTGAAPCAATRTGPDVIRKALVCLADLLSTWPGS
jgi:hypothetical protein